MAETARKRPRFMGDGLSSDDEAGPSKAPAARLDDSLFDLDDDELPAPLDTRDIDRNRAALEAGNKSAAATLDLFGEGGATGDGDEGESGKVKKKRPPRPKIDDARLSGPKGFDALAKDLKRFKSKGKGHEAEDLKRLTAIYQLWAHRLFPSNAYSDTVAAVERVCRQRTMNVYLRNHKADAKGKRHKSDDEAEQPANEAAVEPEAVAVPFGAPAPAPTRAATQTAEEPDFDDADIDAYLEEEEDAMAAMREMEEESSRPAPARPKPTQTQPSQPRGTAATDVNALFDEDVLDDLPEPVATAPPAVVELDDDFDALDAMREIEEQTVPVKPTMPVEEDMFDDLDLDDAALAAVDAVPSTAVAPADADMDLDFDLSEADLAGIDALAA